MHRFRNLSTAIGRHKVLWFGATFGFVLFYYAILLAALVYRFENLPNYVTFYDYFGNVWRILAETPALSDAIVILQDEWLIEAGFMNYDYGHGVSEWSLNVLPTNLAVQLFASALAATAIVLSVDRRRHACSTPAEKQAISAAGGGAFLVGFTTATLSWVVCCATPTWVVSLAMLGMSASLALWLEPAGLVLSVGGFVLLAGSVLWLSRNHSSEVEPA